MARKKKSEPVDVVEESLFGDEVETQTPKKDESKKKTKKEKEEKGDKEMKPKKLSPFDIINLIYKCQNDEFDKLALKELEKNYYIINDRLSIGYPLHAQFFNHYKINGGQVVRCWRNFIQKQGSTYTPKWMYTKGKQKAKEEKIATEGFSKDDIKRFALANELSVVDIEFALKLNHNRTSIEINEWLRTQEEIEKLKKLTFKSMETTKENEEDVIEMDMNDPNQTSFF